MYMCVYTCIHACVKYTYPQEVKELKKEANDYDFTSIPRAIIGSQALMIK
jgi:hypothetical protein